MAAVLKHRQPGDDPGGQPPRTGHRREESRLPLRSTATVSQRMQCSRGSGGTGIGDDLPGNPGRQATKRILGRPRTGHGFDGRGIDGRVP
jgi:hypothetical protein